MRGQRLDWIGAGFCVVLAMGSIGCRAKPSRRGVTELNRGKVAEKKLDAGSPAKDAAAKAKQPAESLNWSGIPYHPKADWSGPWKVLARAEKIEVSGGTDEVVLGRDGVLYDMELKRIGKLPGEPYLVGPDLVLTWRASGTGYRVTRWDKSLRESLWHTTFHDGMPEQPGRLDHNTYQFYPEGAPVLGPFPLRRKAVGKGSGCCDLVAMDVRDGHVLWRRPYLVYTLAERYTNGRVLLVLAPHGQRYALDMATGELLWKVGRHNKACGYGTPCGITPRLVGELGVNEVFDLRDGRLDSAWGSLMRDLAVRASASCVGDVLYGLSPLRKMGGSVMPAGHGGELFAIDLAQKRKLWTVRVCPPGYRVSDPVLSGGEAALYCWNEETLVGHLVVVGRRSGTILHRVSVPRPRLSGRIAVAKLTPVGLWHLGLRRLLGLKGSRPGTFRWEQLLFGPSDGAGKQHQPFR